jgi:transcriptional regulator with XRE-family HTH domain
VSRRKRRLDGGFYQVARLMTRSAAYRSLTPRAGWLLHRLMDEYAGEDNRVSLSRRDAEAWLKSGPHKAALAFDELEDKGFIRLHERGGFTRKVRHATVWTLTMFGRNGQKATLDFLGWQGQPLGPKRQTRKPQKTNHGFRRATNTGIDAPPMDGLIGTDAPPVNQSHGYRRPTNIGIDAPPLIECTIQGRPHNRREQIQSTNQEQHQSKDKNGIFAKRRRGTAWPAAVRQQLGLSQPELARRAGIKREYLSVVEQGRRQPGAEISARIEAALRAAHDLEPENRHNGPPDDGGGGHRPDRQRPPDLPLPLAPVLLQATYGGQPTLSMRLLDVMSDARPWQRGDLAVELGARPAHVGETLKLLCAGGYIERLGHGTYQRKRGVPK